MALKSIQLCHIDPVGDGKYTVSVHDDDDTKVATFKCSDVRAALTLRDAIRENADCLHTVMNWGR
jgi:hypothetical protein